MIAFFSRPLRVIAILALAGVVGAGVWLWQRANSSTPASAVAAVAEYRGGTPVAEERPGVPRGGVYTFRQEGRETGGGTGVSLSRELPDRAVYVITPTADGYREELRHSEEHVEEVRFRVDRKVARAEWRRTKITFLGVGADEEADQAPPPVDHPNAPKVGDTWSGSYRSGETPVTFRAEAVRRERVVLDGREVAAVVLRTESETGDPNPGTRVDEVWWAPSLSLPVRWTIRQEVGGSTTFDMDATLVLESAGPRT